MSYTTAYAYSSTLEIMIREDASRLGEPMNDRNIKIYKGLDNTISIKAFDNKRRAYDMTGKTLEAFFIDTMDGHMVFRKPVTSTAPTTGLAEVLLTYADTANLDPGLYSMTIKAVDDTTQNESLIFSDIGQTANFVVELQDGIMPEPLETQVADTWTADSSTPVKNYSNSINADADKNYTTGLHTLAIYGNNFVGTVYVEGSLEDNPSASDWFAIPIRGSSNARTYTTALNGIEPFNFKASVKKLRFYYTATSGSVDKILARN